MVETDPSNINPTSPQVSSAQGSSNRSHQTQSDPIQDLMKTIIKPQSQLISTHLDETNYLLWKLQVETTIRGYGLDDCIYGTKIAPPRFIRDNEDKLVQNPEFLSYQRQDGLICAWMMSSIGASILP
mgnify:CR=1 FL=1